MLTTFGTFFKDTFFADVKQDLSSLGLINTLGPSLRYKYSYIAAA